MATCIPRRVQTVSNGVNVVNFLRYLSRWNLRDARQHFREHIWSQKTAKTWGKIPSPKMTRSRSFNSARKHLAAKAKILIWFFFFFLNPRRSGFLLCVLGGDAWLLKLAAAPVVHHRQTNPTKLRLIGQRASAARISAARTLLGPAVHRVRKIFHFSYKRAPKCCRCPVSIFRRVCVGVSCTFRGKCAVSCPMLVEGCGWGAQRWRRREALLSRRFLLRTNAFSQRFGPLRPTRKGR